jgi:hypothetical protein
MPCCRRSCWNCCGSGDEPARAPQAADGRRGSRRPIPLRPSLEVADIFRIHGSTWRTAHAGHVSLAQLKVMSAIETCRTAAFGGHVEGCEDCGHRRIAYNSCRNRHCPKCQGAAAREWLAAREADLLPVGYFHVVVTVPAEIADTFTTSRRFTTCCSGWRLRPCSPSPRIPVISVRALASPPSSTAGARP